VLWQQVFAERPATASVFNGLMGLCIGAGLLQVMRLLYFVWRGIEGMGFGDIKMMLMVGMYLGWQYTFANLVLGAFLGVGGAMIFLLYNSRKVQDVQDALQFKIPFGVFLGAAAIILTLSGEDIVGWYLRHFLAVAP
jgi:leader peptidase (prepilin peptidase)/N-methyltransferase